VTGQLELDEAHRRQKRQTDYATSLRKKLAAIINRPGIKRISVPSPLQPCLEDSLRDIDLPPTGQVRN
jgi:hypothetical protein